MGTGFAQWAGGVRNRMSNDPGRADFKDQVQCHGYLFLHEYLDDVLNGPRPENVIELTKTPGRNKTASKRTRAANVSPQKSKPAIPLSFPTSPIDKENVSAPAPSAPQSKAPSRFQHALFTARDDQDDAPHTRDSISRATPNRPGVPVFGSSSKLQSTPAAAPIPSDDPLSPFRDAESPEKGITAQQIFTTRLVIQPSSPVAEPVDPAQEVPATAALEPEPQPAEIDLSVIQEDDEGVSINVFEDARSDFSRPSAETKQTVSDEEEDITIAAAQDEPAPQPQEVLHVEDAAVAPPAAVLSEPIKAPSSPVKTVPTAETVLASKKSLSPIKTASPIKQAAQAQVPPSPPPSEDATAPSPKKPTPEQEPEPTSAVSASEPPPEPVSATSSRPETVPSVIAAPSSTASQPTPPPEPEHVEPAPRPLPVPPMSRANSQNQVPTQTQARPPVSATLAPQPTQAQPPQSRASAAPRGAFTGPSLKELRREPSVSGAAHRELRQSSWRKKPEGAPSSNAAPTITSAPAPAPPVAAAATEVEQPRKRKSSVLARPGASKLQRMRSPSRFSSSSSSPSRSSSEEEETELQVPLKDEDSGSGWSSGGGSVLEDLRHRLARLEKSTSGKTPAASRTWTSSAATSASGIGNNSGGRMSLSDLSLKSRPASSDAAPEAEGNERGTLASLQDEVLALGLSTDYARASMMSNRTTTPDNSPPPPKPRVLPAPPVFALPSPVPALAQPALSFPPPAPVFSQPSTTESSTTASTSNSDAVRANARAEAARFFASSKLAAPAPSRTETQSTIATDIDSIFDRVQSQTQTEFTQTDTQMTGTSLFGLGSEDLIDVDGEADLDLDIDVEGDGEDEEMEESTKMSSRATSLATSTTQTRSMAKKGPVKSIQLAAAAAKKAAEEQDRKTTRMREMEERRQAAALRKADEDKSKSLELEKKRKDREELAASKSAKPLIKKPQEDANKKRKVEAEKKPAEVKKPAGSSLLKEPSMSKSRIAKPTASTAGPSGLKSALKTSTNPFAAPAPPAGKTIKHVGSSSSLKTAAGSAAKKANKASISDAPGQALQAQMQARVQAQLKAAQKEPEVQSESIELPDINSEYSDSDDEDRGKDFPDWTQSPELKQALRDQETFNPDAIFGPIQPLKMGDLFKTGHSRFRKRTSSANWSGTDGITVEEEIEYARRMGYTN